MFNAVLLLETSHSAALMHLTAHQMVLFCISFDDYYITFGVFAKGFNCGRVVSKMVSIGSQQASLKADRFIFAAILPLFLLQSFGQRPGRTGVDLMEDRLP